MHEIRAKIAEGGRVVIPAEYRQALGLKIGDEVLMRLEDDEVHMYSVREAIRRAQAILRRYMAPDVSLVDSLIAQRRTEAEQE